MKRLWLRSWWVSSRTSLSPDSATLLIGRQALCLLFVVFARHFQQTNQGGQLGLIHVAQQIPGSRKNYRVHLRQ